MIGERIGIATSKEIKREGSPINVGLIGLGTCGKNHLEAIQGFPTSRSNSLVKLGATSDLRDVSIPEGTKIFFDYKRLLADQTIEAISVVTQPNSHFQIAKDALLAGKHVLIDKPPVLSLDDYNELVSLSEEKGKSLVMAFHNQYHPIVKAAQKELRDKNITEIDVQYRESVAKFHQTDRWIFDPTQSGGGVLMDSGINALSIITSILPSSTELTVTNSDFGNSEGFQVETLANVAFAFGESGIGNISMDWMNKDETRKIIIITDDGVKYTIDLMENTFDNGVDVLERMGRKRGKEDRVLEYENVYRDFASHITNGTSLLNVKELEFVLKAYELAGLYYGR